MNEKTRVQHKDSDDFYNHYGELHEQLNFHFSHIGSVLSDIKKASERKITNQWVRAISGKSIHMNFNVVSIYVDNSNNPNEITILRDGANGTFKVAANSQEWIHPLSGNFFTVNGTLASDVFLNFVDTLIPVR